MGSCSKNLSVHKSISRRRQRIENRKEGGIEQEVIDIPTQIGYEE